MPRDGLAARFWKRVERGTTNDCWEWTGARCRQGYGTLRSQGRTLSTHRVSWELQRGPVPRGKWGLHRCDYPPCVNPQHLFLGTRTDNVRDMVAKGRNRPARGDAHPIRKHPEKVRGTNNGRARLTESQVIEIRSRAAAGESVAAIARETRMSEGALRHIVKRRKWRHIPEQQSLTRSA